MSWSSLCFLAHRGHLKTLDWGYATILESGNPDPKVVQCVSAIIRGLCLSRNFKYWEDFAEAAGDSDLWPRDTKMCDNVCIVDASQVLTQLRTSRVGIRGQHANMGVNPDFIWLHLNNGIAAGQHRAVDGNVQPAVCIPTCMRLVVIVSNAATASERLF